VKSQWTSITFWIATPNENDVLLFGSGIEEMGTVVWALVRYTDYTSTENRLASIADILRWRGLFLSSQTIKSQQLLK
jgi:hypothetical protein